MKPEFGVFRKKLICPGRSFSPLRPWPDLKYDFLNVKHTAALVTFVNLERTDRKLSIASEKNFRCTARLEPWSLQAKFYEASVLPLYRK